MNGNSIIGIIFILSSFLSTETQYTYTVNTQGRSIQLDAFLIEWNTKSVKKINSKIPVFWDAINTSQGIAGYFRFPVNDSCKKTAIDIFPSLNKVKPSFSIQLDSIPSTKNYYAVEKIDNQEGKSIISEWIIPWDSIPVDSTGKYEIVFFTHNTCEDTLQPIILKGVKPDKLNAIQYSKQIVIQIASIAVLLVLFIILKKRIRY